MLPLRRTVILAIALAFYAIVVPSPIQGLSAAIVISQVYGGGGNSGANYKNDFVELYNRGAAPVSVTGWSVQYASAAGSSWTVTSLAGTIQPGRYYLVQQGAGTGGTADLPTPDAVGTTAMSATAGKVALVSSTTALTGSCPLASTVDFVGFGAANCFEGTGPTAAPSNVNAVLRGGGGTVETDVNSADFSTGLPFPRNGAGAPSGTGAASPTPVPAGASSLLTVFVTPGAPPVSTGITVVGDLSAIGGPAAQAFLDDGTGGDVTAGDRVFSFDAVVAPGTTVGPKTLPLTVADAQGRSTSPSLSLTVGAPVAPSSTLVISEVYGGGGNAGATLKNDFIELYNLGVVAVSVTGWSVQYASATGASWQVTTLSGTIQPGRYYLVQEAAGSGGTLNLPAPDAIGTIAMAAGSGKVALVSSSTALSGGCPSAGVVDFVGYGAANCSETSPTPVLSNTTSALRLNDGATDTNNNFNDFVVGTPDPHGSAGFPPTGTGLALPPSASPSEATTLTVTVVPGRLPLAGGLTVVADLTPIGGPAVQPLVDDGTSGDAVAGDNVFSLAFLLGSLPPGPVTLVATVSDDVPRSSTATIPFTVETSVTPIHDIQGPTSTSAYVGQFVTTTGIVTGVKNNGFFMQTPDADIDADPQTSEGIFVFTGAAPPATNGTLVRTSGTVTEFIPSADPVSPAITEIGGGGTPTPAVRPLSSANPLPAAVTLTGAETNPAGGLEQLERFEGMRVHVDFLRVIAPTQAAFIDERNATSTSNGVFYGVVDGLPRPLREPGIQVPDPLPAGSPCCVPRFDANPERLRVDSDGQIGALPIEVGAGALVSDLTGPLDYAFRTYMIFPDPATPPAVSGNPAAVPVPVPVPDANEFTVASFNMERFFDTVDDPAVDDAVLTAAAFEARLKKASLAIRDVMRTPDIIGVEEVENLAALDAVAARVNADAVAAGQADPMYEARLIEGSDIGGIDVGVLVKQSRAAIVDVTQEGKTATFIDPTDGSVDLLNDRPPLVLRAELQSPLGTTFPVTVIVNHLRSLSGVAGIDGRRIRAKRRAQAEFLANLIQARQAANPAERIVSVGDYNAFEFNDGYVDVVGTVIGAPTPADQVVLASPDLVNPNLTDVVETLPAAERYSFSFDGNGQILDHVLVNAALMDRFSRLHFARNDTDFPESLRNDSTRPERISDHDIPVAYFFFAKAPILVLAGSNPMAVECHTPFVDPGATASDADLGDLTSRIQVSGQVDTSTPGTYTLTYSVSNVVLTTTLTRTVVVSDTTPPTVSLPAVSVPRLSPPDHRMVDVEVFYNAADTCSSPSCSLSVASSEPVNGPGDGNTSIDWAVVDGHHVRLRAERSGRGNGRTYTITVRCQDAAGNVTVRTVTVHVPKGSG